MKKTTLSLSVDTDVADEVHRRAEALGVSSSRVGEALLARGLGRDPKNIVAGLATDEAGN